jgi:hypothetical protein
MPTYTSGHGAITAIADSRTSLTTSNGAWEVFPINITQQAITTALQTVSPHIWFIAYETSLTPPTAAEIQDALTKGQLIKLSISCSIIDNRGFIHTLSFNPTSGVYSIKLNPMTKDSITNTMYVPLSDKLIDIVKTSANPRAVIRGLTLSSRILINALMDRVTTLETTIATLDQRITQLEPPPT